MPESRYWIRGVRAVGLMLTAFAAMRSRADSTWVYSVQINADVQAAPPRIALNWLPDVYGAKSYTVFRKSKDGASWGSGTTLPGSATGYVDNTVAPGQAYEYQVIKDSVPGYKGYGYIYAGIQAPLNDTHGKVILMVDNSHAAELDTELTRLEQDLVGDGWAVIRHDVSRSDSAGSVRSQIIADYNADPLNVKAVFLFGHVPVMHSGNLNYDGHYYRSMPADSFYGDMDGNWSQSPSYLPSDVELMVGRVDLFDMPGSGSSTPWPNEAELLRNYLNKDHAWRQAQMNVPLRALMGDRRGAESGEATAASGYRNFAPLLGNDATVLANAEDSATPDQRWISRLSADAYLWAYGCGGGQPTAISHLGTHGQYFDVWSTDVVGQDAKAVFVMLFGSYFGNWDSTDNIMRSFLATSLGLEACMAGRPHWFMHRMGLGEPIGDSARLSMNNSTLYRNDVNANTRAVYVSLMGDPTLRLYPVAPPGWVSGVDTAGGVVLNWAPSTDTVAGYHVFRSTSPAGPFQRLTGELLEGTSFEDASPPPGEATYMVRAIKLQTTHSGTFFNPSQGAFTTLTAASPALPIIVQSEVIADKGVTLTWNSHPGIVYHVEASFDPIAQTWLDVSGTLAAEGSVTSWLDPASNENPQRFYRVVSP